MLSKEKVAGELQTSAIGLRAWASAQWGSGAAVTELEDLGGHSGKTLGFTVTHGRASDRLVVRLAPAGVSRRGNADVLRQAPLLRALHAHGACVARVREASEDTRFFGVPFLIVERLPGRPLTMGPDAPRWDLDSNERQRAHCVAARTLAHIHALDVSVHLGAWDTPRSPQQEIEFWTAFLARSPEPGWVAAGFRLRESLLGTMPTGCLVGLCHGDFQTNNILFTGDRKLAVTGVVDWEIAGIGAIDLDLAWYLMMNDPAAWHPVELRGGVDLAEIVAAYESAAGRRILNLPWFWSLACFRIAAIAALNIKLHRTGRRLDDSWERAALSVPFMFSRGLSLLEEADT